MVNTTPCTQARYTEQLIHDYQGLPLIEALPPILNEVEAEEALHYYPTFRKSEKQLDVHLRLHCIDRIFQFNQPWERHIDLEQRISRMIRGSYANRYPLNPDNPLAPNQARRVNEIYEGIKSKSYKSVNLPAMRSSGLTLIGVSGTGKSRAIESILNTYPQVIMHNAYKGKSFNHKQVVWMKINCPSNGSLKKLCQDFLDKYDLIANENTFNRYGGGTAETISLQICRIAEICTLGLLVIDEIQNLSTAKSGGQENVLNFFVNLRNKIGVPVILVGTPQAMGVIQRDFRQARRGSGQQGDMIWLNIHRSKERTWELIMRGIWHYQWTKRNRKYSQELADVLYEESQGILDIAIKLFAMAQVRAIRTGEEIITEEIIRRVAHEQLKLVQPMLNALRSGKPNLLIKYPDIQPIIWEEFMGEENRVSQKKQHHNNQRNIPVVEDNTLERKSQKKLHENKNVMKSDDFARIIKADEEKGVGIYESLKDAGYIIDIEKDL